MSRKFEFWFGDDISLADYQKVKEASLDKDVLRSRLTSSNDEDELDILSIHDNVAVIDIQGSLLSHSNWVTRMFGMTGYPDIRNALINAHETAGVDTIVLKMATPGGAAMGVDDASSLISEIKKTKKVVAHTDRLMTSAGYWIGASASEVYATKMATLGSIGVITVHQEYTKALENEGIKATVFRAGEFKALGNPMEHLTPQAKASIQKRLDRLYDDFVNHVALSRNTTPKIVHDTMADGREFFGDEALQAGLIDGLMTFDQLMAKLHKPAKASTTTGGARFETVRLADLTTETTRTEASDMKTKILTPEAAAAAAEGAPVDGLEISTEATETPETPETPETTETPAAGGEQASTETPAQPETLAGDSALVNFLKTELATANEKVMQLTVETRELGTKLDSLTASHAQMRTIVEDSANNKRIALGGARSDLSSLSDEALLQQHAQNSAEFSKTFPVGGRAPLPSTETETSAEPSSRMQAGIRSVRTK